MSSPDSPSVPSRPWHPVPHFVAPAPDVAAAVMDVYQAVDARVAGLGAACRACGSCCDFPRSGQVLFATALELDVLTAWAAAHRPLQADEAGAALRSGHCPFWRQGRCLARPARLLGCRTYFCDRSAAQTLQEACEESLRQVDALAARGGRVRWYGPAVEYLLGNMSHLIPSLRPHKNETTP